MRIFGGFGAFRMAAFLIGKRGFFDRFSNIKV